MSIHETTIICHLCKNPNPIHRETCLNCGEPIAVAPPDTNIGTTIKEKYKIERRLGAGGMGTVYLAKQFPMKRSCVLKLLNKEVMSDPANAKRFEREAIMCSKIWHPNAVQIYDYDYAEDGSPFIAMEYIKGIPFGRIIKTDYPFSTERIVHIFTQLCDVLEAGHVRGIVHRDLKPDNVMLMDLPTEEDFVKLLDFGLAKIAEPGDEAQEITQAGWALGTPKYMSPEQCRGTQVGPPTDIYALGVLLYYTCAGVLPFQADTIAALMMKQATEKPVSPSRRSQGGVIHQKI
ncbi:MAG: serine/threonine-protein kinase [Myxococcota bacterium]|nr:serine/threonine-protein kinase [Myxococcota bacterium]